ncbi:hypothetical protein HY992_02250 [Candidatus Micrarchaeota archaeon]|nr:hypothetical protein [Candidatus Micrarchaeota archaeon]
MGEVHKCKKCKTSVNVGRRQSFDETRFMQDFPSVLCKRHTEYDSLPKHCPDCGFKTRWQFVFTF